MIPIIAKISTTVRNLAQLYGLRLGFVFGSHVAPQATLKRAARLFSTPMASSRSRALAASTCGARQIELLVDDHRIAAYVWGDPKAQPYVLFAHGWSSHGTRIAAWLPQLRAEGYAVVAFDQPAHGRSPGRQATLPDFTRHLLAVGNHFGPAAAVIGHSLGGAATMLAMARGLQAERAVLIAPAADPVAAAERFAGLMWIGANLCQRMFSYFERIVGTTFDEQQTHRNAPVIGRPALIVHDLEDRDVPWSEGERYARYWPDSRLLTTRGLGHRRVLDDSGVITAGMRFLSGEEVGEHLVSSPNLPFGVA
ncbi:alpha/beta fold hydrolase [Lysobacter niastensis]|uniref:alpha/beta fold hydrolase n=1 Tax=Lysobacter niastensis TaxID=380629 RepID=UPI002B4B26F9|nr:alpha/beta fold hydrolase [Lysobacter niastensis]